MKSSASSPKSARVVPGDHLGIHAHNDTDNAVANSLAAVRAGVRQVQGTLNGLGERCGNANLVSLIPTLALKADLAEQFEIGVSGESLRDIAKISHAFDELLNRAPDRHAPYVGASAFATKAGIHASALAKDPRTYEHVPPESVGNARAILVSDQAGRSNLIAQLARMGIEARADDPRLVAAARRGEGRARRKATPMRRPTRRSNCWRGACSAAFPTFSTSRVSTSASSASSIPPASSIRPRRRWSKSASARKL